MFSLSVLKDEKKANHVNSYHQHSRDGQHVSGEDEGGCPLDEEVAERNEVEEDNLENNSDVPSDIPRVSISMDTSSALSVETCREVSLDIPIPDSRASSTTKLLPHEDTITAASCRKKKKQLLRSQTMATTRRVPMASSCHGYSGTQAREMSASVSIDIENMSITAKTFIWKNFNTF